MSEHAEQVALMEWAATRQSAIPELAYLFSVPNGGKRAKKTAIDLSKEGLKPGVPDLFLPVPSRGHHGLWIEMKVRPNKITEHQARWLAWLAGQDYSTAVCYGWQDAAALIENYLCIPASARTEFYR